jgi:hypothetical protein
MPQVLTCTCQASHDMPLKRWRSQQGTAAARLWRRILRAARAGKQVAVELFSGSGRVANFWRRRWGLHSIAVDIRNKRKCHRYDITSRPVLRVLKKAILRKHVVLVYMGTPCSSFSLARRGKAGSPGGPLRLKGKYILGHRLALARAGDRLKIQIGNKCAEASAEIAKTANRAACPWALENPGSSRLFHHPSIAECINLPGVHSRKLDMCRYSRGYKKSTRVLIGCVDEAIAPQLLTKRCSCKADGREHTILEGRSPSTGRPRTASAQVYPWAFAREAATLLAQVLS